jgi:hypothetical protein
MKSLDAHTQLDYADTIDFFVRREFPKTRPNKNEAPNVGERVKINGNAYEVNRVRFLNDIIIPYWPEIIISVKRPLA